MKLFVLPALMLALSGSAHAGLAVTFNVNSAVHWTSVGLDQHQDSQALTPFGGTLRSNLTLQRCNTYNDDYRLTYCRFDADFSDFYSPYDNEYLARIGGQADSAFQWLRVTLFVERDGAYSGRFTFGNTAHEYIGDDDRGFDINYQFHFSGTGMALDTTMDKALAEKLWRNQKISYTRYWNQWTHDRIDRQTGEQIPLTGEGWDGTMEMAAVPEPASLALFGIGFAGFAFLRRKKRD